MTYSGVRAEEVIRVLSSEGGIRAEYRITVQVAGSEGEAKLVGRGACICRGCCRWSKESENGRLCSQEGQCNESEKFEHC